MTAYDHADLSPELLLPGIILAVTTVVVQYNIIVVYMVLLARARRRLIVDALCDCEQHAECCRDGWEALEKCDMILMCVDPKDTVACCKRLSSAVKKGSDTAIVGFDLGVRNHMAFEME